MESNFALASCISAPQALKQWITGHTAAVNNLKAANAHVAECNRGKQKLVDAEKKAKTSLATEKEKTKKLSKEVASLKKQLKQKNKGKKGGSQDDTADDEGKELAQMREELEKANKEVERLETLLEDNEQKLASTQKNLEDAVTQISELKSMNISSSLELGEDADAPYVKEMEEEVSELKKENAKLRRQLKEATKKKGAAKDSYADNRNEDVNKAIKDYVYEVLSRSVVFMPTEENETMACQMVWDSLKTVEKLESYHKLNLETFTLYYGPVVKNNVNQKRSDLQAAMKRAARGKLHYFWANCSVFSLDEPLLTLTYGRNTLHLVMMGRKVSLDERYFSLN